MIDEPLQPDLLAQSDSLVLLERLPSETITLAYLDPPWHPEIPEGDIAERQFLEFLSRVIQQSLRVLKPTGTLYFHSLPSMTGVTRTLLDHTFGRKNFRADIIWPRRVQRSGATELIQQHDTIHIYSKSDVFTYHPPTRALRPDEIQDRFPHADNRGPYRLADLTVHIKRPQHQFDWHGFVPPPEHSWRFPVENLNRLAEEGNIAFSDGGRIPKHKVYLKDNATIEVESVWYDLDAASLGPSLHGKSSPWRSRLPTQQPAALLERIIKMASNERDVILDPFCGAGTALTAAQSLRRCWIGCDISPEAIAATSEDVTHVSQNAADYVVIDQETLERRPPVVAMKYKKVYLGYADDSVRELIDKGEGGKCEFKAVLRATNAVPAGGYDPQHECLLTVAAFLNSEGGTLLIGVTDDKKILGIRAEEFGGQDRFMLHFWNLLHQAIGKPASNDVQAGFEEIDGKLVFVVECSRSKVPIYLRYRRISEKVKEKEEEFYMRTGPSSKKLTISEAVEYITSHFDVA